MIFFSFISLSLWINPQPINTNINYNRFTTLFNYANKPNILYNAKTNTIKIICETKKNHLVNIYESNNFPITEKYSKEILSLPMYPELTEKKIDLITSKIKNFFKNA